MIMLRAVLAVFLAAVVVVGAVGCDASEDHNLDQVDAEEWARAWSDYSGELDTFDDVVRDLDDDLSECADVAWDEDDWFAKEDGEDCLEERITEVEEAKEALWLTLPVDLAPPGCLVEVNNTSMAIEDVASAARATMAPILRRDEVLAERRLLKLSVALNALDTARTRAQIACDVPDPGS